MHERILGLILILGGIFTWLMQANGQYSAMGIFVTIACLIIGLWLLTAPRKH